MSSWFGMPIVGSLCHFVVLYVYSKSQCQFGVLYAYCRNVLSVRGYVCI